MSVSPSASQTQSPAASAPSTTTSSASPSIEVDDLHKHYGDLHVLRGVSMAANEGDVVSVIGASGSGKSTFLRCINMLELPSQGSIRIAGEDVRFGPKRKGEMIPADRKQVQRLRAGLSMVFQGFNLWGHMTVLQNVIEAPIQVLGMKKAEAIERGEAMLHRVGLYDKRDQYPAFLSGGQQQRAAIARALAMEPRALLFDEPTSALDPELVGEVLKVIRGIAEEGRTMILVTHEMAFARDVSSKVMFLHQGQVEEEGTPHQVFNQSKSERCKAFVQSVH